MCLRELARWLSACGSALAVMASGCGDSDEHPERDAGPDGGAEGGTPEAGPGRDSGAEGVTCGANTCVGVPLITTTLTPCCVLDDDGQETDVCGLNAEDIKKINPTSPLTGCMPKDVPYASLSEYCGTFFDQVEPTGDHTNSGLDVASPTGTFVFEGCCLPTGACGANITTPRGLTADVIDTHLGCVSYGRLGLATGADPSFRPDLLPFCVPDTGEPPSSGTVPGVPEFVCGCGVGVVDDQASLPCLNNLPEEVCGADPVRDEELAQIPEFICGGCSADSVLPCLKNLAASTCGTKPVADSAAELAKVPAFICGGDNAPFPTLANVDAAVCGSAEVEAGSEFLVDVPALVCGCEDASGDSGYPCLQNVAHDVCGLSLALIPEFVTGCGEDTALGASERLCIPYRPASVRGEKVTQVDEARECLVDLPEYAVGCGEGDVTESCIPDASAYFGCDEAGAGETVRGAPDYVCGCGDGVPYSPATRVFPCLSNVPHELCGAIPVAVNPVPDVPEYVCGCGAGNYYAGVGTPCLADRSADVCGALDTQLGSRDFGGATGSCLVGVPEYAQGCGDGPNGVRADGEDSCLPHAGAPITDPLNPPPRLFGCTEVTLPPPNLFEYVCGCGDDGAYAGGLPCLSYVDESVCGALAAAGAAALLPALQATPNTYCGCGDGQQNDDPASLDCLPNVPRDVCAPAPADIDLGAAGPEDDCVVGFPEGALGCGEGTTAETYPITCIPNVAATLPGCPI